MLILVTGGSGSGKSAYAEELLLSLTKQGETRYYIATMQVIGEEGKEKVRRHKRLRAGKGLLTIESPRDIGAVEIGEKQSAALLECMSNLTANEMFCGEVPCEKERVTEKIMTGVAKLQSKCKHLVIVTNQVFEDGIRYEDGTMEYLAALGEINRKLAERADAVVEVVAGIPVWQKGVHKIDNIF